MRRSPSGLNAGGRGRASEALAPPAYGVAAGPGQVPGGLMIDK